jgi:subtilisin family serine protease
MGDEGTSLEESSSGKADPRLLTLLRVSDHLKATQLADASFLSDLKRIGADDRAFISATHGVFRDESGPQRARVFIKFTCSRDHLKRLGVEVRSVAGDIATADVWLSDVELLLAQKVIVYMELSRAAKTQLDRTVPEIGVRPQPDPGDPRGGEGVCIGFVDEGLDILHPAFYRVCPTTQAWKTRIRHLWVQNPRPDERIPERPSLRRSPRPPPSPWNIGVEYTGAEIDEELENLRTGKEIYKKVDYPPIRAPREGHGTSVAGVAAGSGAGSELFHQPACGPRRGVFMGVAPAADLLFVDTVGSGLRGLADMTEIADALDYLFTRAAGRPCVVNVSMNDQLGPHDGTSLVEQFIDRLLETPGRAVVISAGNQSNDANSAQNLNKHASGGIESGAMSDVLFTVPPNGPIVNEAIEIWYDGDDRLSVTLIAPDGTSFGPIQPDDPTRSCPLAGVRVTIASVLDDRRNHDNVIAIFLVVAAGTTPTSAIGTPTSAIGTWTIRLGASSSREPAVSGAPVEVCWHGWIDRNTDLQWKVPTTDQLTIGPPATASRAITVGAYKLTEHPGQPPFDPILCTSGRGFTRKQPKDPKERTKPDFSAPGLEVATSWRQQWPRTPPDDKTALYHNFSGTSSAAPHVAGVIALLFQRRPDLSAEEVYEMLSKTCDRTGLVEVPDRGHGRGRIRASTAYHDPEP